MSEPTPSQLKNAIDSGGTGDKVDYPDPSASPLGTDSEAGGTSFTRGEASTAKGLEAQAEAGKNTDPARTRTFSADPYGLPILLAVAAAVVMGAGLWALLT